MMKFRFRLSKLIWEVKLNMVYEGPMRKKENIYPGAIGANFLYFFRPESYNFKNTQKLSRYKLQFHLRFS